VERVGGRMVGGKAESGREEVVGRTSNKEREQSFGLRGKCQQNRKEEGISGSRVQYTVVYIEEERELGCPRNK
jgi:hypothetical protein